MLHTLPGDLRHHAKRMETLMHRITKGAIKVAVQSKLAHISRIRALDLSQ